MQQFDRAKEIRWMYAILLLSVSLLLMAIGFTFRIFKDTSESFDRIEKSNALIDKASAFEADVFRNESRVRLAIIAKTASTLNLEKEHTDSKASLSEIKKLTTDSLNIAAIDSADRLLGAWFALLSRVQQLLRDSVPSQYLVAGLTAHGSYISSQISGLIQEIKNNERVHLKRSSIHTKNGIMVISAVLTAATLFSLAFIMFAFRRLHGEINKEVEIQVKLQDKIVELDRSNAHLERFAYTASHDLQEPLRKLNVFSERLVQQEKNNLSPEGREVIDRMQKFVARMQKLIEDLLLFSRTFSDKLVKAPVNLNQVLAEVKQNMSENILSSGAIITASPLPWVAGYESQVQQLFQNLISNSIRYGKKDAAPQISITTRVVTGDKIPGVKAGDERKKFNLIAFADNGIGFDNKYSEKIFEIFQRLHGKSEYEGTGIGLAICKLVAENHDGYIRANGTEGEGAVMTVYFPAG